MFCLTAKFIFFRIDLRKNAFPKKLFDSILGPFLLNKYYAS